MKIQTKVILSTIPLALGIMAFGANAASAAPNGNPANYPEICNAATYVYCLNNWDDAYGRISDYSSNTPNDRFNNELVALCDVEDTVTDSCPFTGDAYSWNTYFAQLGAMTAQIQYGDGSGYCVATDSSGYADAGTCNDVETGKGGSTGTIEIFVPQSGGGFKYVSKYYTQYYNTPLYLDYQPYGDPLSWISSADQGPSSWKILND